MLSYRHGFHAGSAADVFKHSVLVFCLEYLRGKDKPFLYIDTHAGAGWYPLDTGTGSRGWERGIGRLGGLGPEAPSLLRRYGSLCGMPLDGPLDGSLDGSLPCRYPGSPAIAAKLLRAGDRGACFELHPADFAALEGALGGDRRFSLRHEDGLTGLKSLLPPLCRRALVLIDPAYEDAAEYRALPAALEEALRRFPAGVYLVWYPLLGPGAPGSRRRTGDDGGLGEILMALNGGNRCRVELHTAPVGSPGLYGSGLALYNPPWTLKPELEAALPVLARLLGGGETGWDLDWRVQ